MYRYIFTVVADLMFYSKEKKAEFISVCYPEELADINDEYFALVEDLEKMFIEIGYTCTIEQVDDLIWIVCAQK